jgi:hypothetical protein
MKYGKKKAGMCPSCAAKMKKKSAGKKKNTPKRKK